jgi:hypothetical protein
MSLRVLNLLAALAAAALLAAVPASGQQLRGVDLHPMGSDQDPSTISREFDLLQRAGATSVRFDVFWTAVEWSGKG